MAYLLGIGTAVPPQSYTQDEILRMAGYAHRGVHRIFHNSGIQKRHFAVEPGFAPKTDPQWFADHYTEWAPRLGAEAAKDALRQSGVDPDQIDYLVAASCTGYICPGISQRIAQGLGLKPQLKTANLVGMGCAAAVPAIERAYEFVRVHPEKKALVIASEVCSAAHWVDETDLETAVGNAIFADGAAAVVVSGKAPEKSAPRFHAFATRSDRALIGDMGFYNDSGRLRVLLSRDVPERIVPLTGALIDDLLSASKLRFEDIDRWILHPGGKRILELASERWNLEGKLKPSWDVLAQYGNLSSATVLFVLREHLQSRKVEDEPEWAVMLSMGPGLTVEGAILKL